MSGYFSKRLHFLDFFLLYNICGILFVSVVQTQDFSCPPASEISPCTCEVNAKGENITCAGPQVTQESINNVFKLIRQVNNIASFSSPNGTGENTKEWLYLHEFGLHSTQLSEFDWTPLIKSRMEILDITGNPYLLKLVGPPIPIPISKQPETSNSSSNSTSILGSIEVNSLTIQRNALTEEGFGNTFRYISSALQSLDLRRNLLSGTGTIGSDSSLIEPLLDNQITLQTPRQLEPESEFLPGFSTLTNLVYLDLAQNNISKVKGGLFKRNTKLSVLYLSNNPIVEIGQDAFLFDNVPLISNSDSGSDSDSTSASVSELTDDHLSEDKNAGTLDPNKSKASRRIFISLFNNSLNEDRLLESTGLERFKGRVYLNLEFNQFTTLPQNKFQPFLDAQMGNTINLYQNPLVCDQRLLWLKENVEKYEKFVRFAECSNDRGHSVFSTKLILKNSKFLV